MNHRGFHSRCYLEIFSILKTTSFSYGGTAGIVTSVSLIVGLNAASATRVSIVSALLIVALADNLTDALSIHIYQESERLNGGEAFKTTLANVAARFAVSLSFVLLILFLPITSAVIASALWGIGLLVALTAVLARERKVSVPREVVKHVVVAMVVLSISKAIGWYISIQA